MAFYAKNGVVSLDRGTMDYIRFGTGPKQLLILPGLGDGLRTVKGTALPMALMYRMFAKDYTVWAFSRVNGQPAASSTRDMARDAAEAMERLDMPRADVLGVSMGGMIAQWLAIDHPDRVGRLVLAVTCPGPNPVLEASIGEWLDCAEGNDHTALMRSNLRRIYSAGYCRKYGWMVPILGRLTRPGSYDRFRALAESCRTHDARDELCRIQAPTLVIGGERDLALGSDASRELADRIPGAALRMYEKWGHGLYEEAPDFNETVLTFLKEGAK